MMNHTSVHTHPLLTVPRGIGAAIHIAPFRVSLDGLSIMATEAYGGRADECDAQGDARGHPECTSMHVEMHHFRSMSAAPRNPARCRRQSQEPSTLVSLVQSPAGGLNLFASSEKLEILAVKQGWGSQRRLS
eukprot:1139852-Pelagomonas_calceolata.AAC.10